MKPKTSGCTIAVLGAVISNVLAIVFVFSYAAILGTSRQPFHPNGRGGGGLAYGVEGGLIALLTLGILSILTIGAIPLFISLFGAGVASVIYRVRRNRKGIEAKVSSTNDLAG